MTIRPIIPEDATSLLRIAQDSGLFPPDHIGALTEMLRSYLESESNEKEIWLTAIEEATLKNFFDEGDDKVTFSKPLSNF